MTTGTISKEALSGLSPREIRARIRDGRWTERAEGVAPGYAMANLTVIPQDAAFDFLTFCLRNPVPCPIIEVTDPGSPWVKRAARDADLRTDLGRYRVYRHGEPVDETDDISEHWRDDLVGFLLGCSYSFETALLDANVSLRHIEEKKIAPVYATRVPCTPAGRFSGPMMVSMRPIRRDQVVRAVQVTSRFPATHGAPVHIGDPSAIGIDNLNDVCYDTDRIEVRPDEVPVFWGCAFTAHAAAMKSKLDLLITHQSGHLLITDMLSEEIAAL